MLALPVYYHTRYYDIDISLSIHTYAHRVTNKHIHTHMRVYKHICTHMSVCMRIHAGRPRASLYLYYN